MRLIGKLTPKLSLYGTISKTAEVIGSNIQPLTVRNNGTYEASNGVDGFNPIYVNTPEPKEEQEKIVDIIENGTVEVLPDGNKALSKVTIKSNVPDTSDIIEDIIDNSGVLEDTEGTVTEKVEKLIDKAEIEKCLYEASKNKTNMQDLFAYYTGNKLPRVDCSKVTQAQRFAEYSEIEEVDYYLNFSVCPQLMNAFQNTTKLKTMVGIDTSNATDVRNMFNKSGIVSIQEPFDFSKILLASNTSAFTTANSLVEVRFKTETMKYSIKFSSALLSAESIQSIIDGLATVTTAQTLTLHADVKAKLTQTQLDTISGKNWNLA